MEGHIPLLIQVLRLDRKNVNGISGHMLSNEPRERKRNLKLPDTDLNGHLPQTGHTEVAIIGFALDEVSHRIAEPVASANEPEECVGIQKEVHNGM
jgi:hypothetical protein